MLKKIVLLNSLSDDLISGGNIYNHHLIQGLSRLGLEAEQVIVDLDSSWSNDLNDDTVYLLDSILLRYTLDWDNLSGQKIALLLHMCPTLDSDLSIAEKSAFRQNEITAYQRLPIISTGANNLNYIRDALKVKTKHSVVIPPAVHSYWLKCKKLPDAPTRLLTLGGISRGKGLKRTLEVLHNIKDIPWTWSHYGPVRDRKLFVELQQLVRDYNLNDRVHFHGAIDHEAINDTLLHHHLLLHLSDHENYGMAIQESIATGLPFVMTPVGDYRDLEDRGLGWINGSFDSESVAILLSDVMQDKQKYIAMVEHLQVIDIDTWDRVADRTLQFIQSQLC